MLWKEGFVAVTLSFLSLVYYWSCSIEKKHWEDDAATHCIVNRFQCLENKHLAQTKFPGAMQEKWSMAVDAHLCTASAYIVCSSYYWAAVFRWICSTCRCLVQMWENRKNANYLLAVLHTLLPFSAEEEQKDDAWHLKHQHSAANELKDVFTLFEGCEIVP